MKTGVKSSDQILTTNNPVLLRRTKELDAVLCVQKSVQKKVVTEDDLIRSNKNGFGDDIGSTTNKITAMIDVASSFDKDSNEYKELQYRIICGQNYQQNAIDKMKGILSKSMPREWYDYHSAKTVENKDFNINILADKKPYFFIYNYPYLMKKYKKYIGNANKNCLMRFGLTVDELINKTDKNEQESLFLMYYYRKMPVYLNKSTMNRICWKIEQEFDRYKDKIKNIQFDHTILMSNGGYYLQSRFNNIKDLYEEYLLITKQHTQTNHGKEDKDDKKIKRYAFIQDFKKRAYEICNNSEELCNIVVDLCYTNNSSKQFAWDICGDTIIDNLLTKSEYVIEYPIANDNGDIEFSGERFSLFFKKLDCEDNYETDFE